MSDDDERCAAATLTVEQVRHRLLFQGGNEAEHLLMREVERLREQLREAATPETPDLGEYARGRVYGLREARALVDERKCGCGCWERIVARTATVLTAKPETPDLGKRGEVCGGCPHPRHIGACMRRNGGTAYQCPCIKDTLPSETWYPLDEYKRPCETCGGDGYFEEGGHMDAFNPAGATRRTTCTACKGTGAYSEEFPVADCTACDGTGKAKSREEGAGAVGVPAHGEAGSAAALGSRGTASPDHTGSNPDTAPPPPTEVAAPPPSPEPAPTDTRVFIGVDPGVPGSERTFHRCTGCEWFIDTTAMSEAGVTAAVHEHLRAEHNATPAPEPVPPVAARERAHALLDGWHACGRLPCPLCDRIAAELAAWQERAEALERELLGLKTQRNDLVERVQRDSSTVNTYVIDNARLERERDAALSRLDTAVKLLRRYVGGENPYREVYEFLDEYDRERTGRL